MLQDITTGLQSVSAAGAVTGSLDTSGNTGDYTIWLRVAGLDAGKRAIIAIEDTANASAFSDARQVAVQQVIGAVTPDTEVKFSWRAYQLPMLRYGSANTKLRANVLAVDGSPNLKVHAYLEK